MKYTIGIHKKPLALSARGGVQVLGWSCGACDAIFTPGDDVAEEMALFHCAERICGCGQHLKPPYVECVDCLMLARIEKEEAEREVAFKTAKKITWQDYWRDNPDAQVYCQIDDAYYPNADTLLNDGDYTFFPDPDKPPHPSGRSEPDTAPTWAWACTSIKLRMCAQDFIDSALDEHFEDAGGALDTSDEVELQKLLDEWCAKQNVQTFFPDYTRIVTFDDLVADRFTNEMAEMYANSDGAEGDEDEVSEGK